MDQLELVFRLLVRLQFMYFQYNMYLSIVVRTNIVFFIYMHMIQNNLRTPQLAGFARQLGCRNMVTFRGGGVCTKGGVPCTWCFKLHHNDITLPCIMLPFPSFTRPLVLGMMPSFSSNGMSSSILTFL